MIDGAEISQAKVGVRFTVFTAVMLGIVLGVSGYTFRYADGLSYFSTDPNACANCHIMRPQLDSWQKASHHGVAACVDCHLPQAFVAKYMAKAENGYHHSKGFTFQDFHEPIMLKEKSRRILQHNCVACHQEMVDHLVSGTAAGPGTLQCIHCHASVGHGEPVGLGGPDRGEDIERKIP